jgi:hypothetical protein
MVEVVTGAVIMMLLTLGTMTLLVSGARSYERTSTDINIAEDNAQGMRRVADKLRSAMSATVTESGTRVTFSWPNRSNTNDPVTGEREITYPMAADGVARGFKVDFAAGTLTDTQTGTVLVRDIRSTDPDPQSTTYNQAYQPFTLTSVGARRGVVINLITAERVNGQLRYQRMKTTIMLRNVAL